MNSDDELARFIERSQNKYWGKYRGFVVDRNDPSQLGRLRVRVPSVLGTAETGWAWPVACYAGAGYGLLLLPQVGDVVFVEFLEGELEHPLWSGGAWTAPNQTTEIPSEARANYPDTPILRTASGHVIILDDTQGSEKITIRDGSGSCEITLDPNANQITVSAGAVVVKSSGTAQELATKDFVQQIFDNHVHPSGVGPTGPPNPTSSSLPGVAVLTSVLTAE